MTTETGLKIKTFLADALPDATGWVLICAPLMTESEGPKTMRAIVVSNVSREGIEDLFGQLHTTTLRQTNRE